RARENSGTALMTARRAEVARFSCSCVPLMPLVGMSRASCHDSSVTTLLLIPRWCPNPSHSVGPLVELLLRRSARSARIVVGVEPRAVTLAPSESSTGGGQSGRVSPVDQTAQFEAERPRLVSIAHRILGDHAGAQDIVQQAWLRLHGTDAQIDSLPAWLTTVTT